MFLTITVLEQEAFLKGNGGHTGCILKHFRAERNRCYKNLTKWYHKFIKCLIYHPYTRKICIELIRIASCNMEEKMGQQGKNPPVQGALRRSLVIKCFELNMINLTLCTWGSKETNQPHHLNNERKLYSVCA